MLCYKVKCVGNFIVMYNVIYETNSNTSFCLWIEDPKHLERWESWEDIEDIYNESEELSESM